MTAVELPLWSHGKKSYKLWEDNGYGDKAKLNSDFKSHFNQSNSAAGRGYNILQLESGLQLLQN